MSSFVKSTLRSSVGRMALTLAASDDHGHICLVHEPSIEAFPLMFRVLQFYLHSNQRQLFRLSGPLLAMLWRLEDCSCWIHGGLTSNTLYNVANSLYIPTLARCFPMQTRFPAPYMRSVASNIRLYLYAKASLLSFSPRSHRSGR